MYWEDIEKIVFYWEIIGQSLAGHWQNIDIERRLGEYWEIIERMLMFLNIWPSPPQGK